MTISTKGMQNTDYIRREPMLEMINREQWKEYLASKKNGELASTYKELHDAFPGRDDDMITDILLYTRIHLLPVRAYQYDMTNAQRYSWIIYHRSQDFNRLLEVVTDCVKGVTSGATGGLVKSYMSVEAELPRDIRYTIRRGIDQVFRSMRIRKEWRSGSAQRYALDATKNYLWNICRMELSAVSTLFIEDKTQRESTLNSIRTLIAEYTVNATPALVVAIFNPNMKDGQTLTQKEQLITLNND